MLTFDISITVFSRKNLSTPLHFPPPARFNVNTCYKHTDVGQKLKDNIFYLG